MSAITENGRGSTWVIASDRTKDGTPIVRETRLNAANCYVAINRSLGEKGPSAEELRCAALIARAPDLLAENERLREALEALRSCIGMDSSGRALLMIDPISAQFKPVEHHEKAITIQQAVDTALSR